MAYEHETDRIDLGDGHWTVMFKELKHGTERRVKDLGRKYLRGKDGINPSFQFKDSDNGEQKTEVIGEIEVDLEHFDATAATDLMILLQTVEWSFGEITQEVLDDLPKRIHDKLDAAMKERYVFPLASSGGDGSGNSSSSPSRRERRHPPTSKKQS